MRSALLSLVNYTGDCLLVEPSNHHIHVYFSYLSSVICQPYLLSHINPLSTDAIQQNLTKV